MALPPALEQRVRRRLVAGDGHGMPLREAIGLIASQEAVVPAAQLDDVVDALAAAMAGLGPLEVLLADASVSEVMVNGPREVWVERSGRLERTDVVFADAAAVRSLIERVVGPLGLRVDDSHPIADARLADGSRFHAVVPPVSLRGPVCNIRRFVLPCRGFADLVATGAVDASVAAWLEAAVAARRSVLVSGATSTGKTTFLNALSAAISPRERIVTIEDAAELRLAQPHVVGLEARPAGPEGSGAVGVRDLVRAALRMRPDRVVVGEVRGPEAVDMLAAMTTGHDGSLSTVHASSPADALARLEMMILLAEPALPASAVRRQLSRAIDVVVQLERASTGERRVASVVEVRGIDTAGEVVFAEAARA